MNMKKLTAARINELKAMEKNAVRMRKVWVTDPEEDLTLEEYATYVNPCFKDVEEAMIIAIPKENGGYFNKMWMKTKEGVELKVDLSYTNSFEEGDEIDVSTIVFRTERFLKESRLYVTGEVI